MTMEPHRPRIHLHGRKIDQDHVGETAQLKLQIELTLRGKIV